MLNIRLSVDNRLFFSEVFPCRIQHSFGQIRQQEFSALFDEILLPDPDAPGSAAKFQYPHSFANIIMGNNPVSISLPVCGILIVKRKPGIQTASAFVLFLYGFGVTPAPDLHLPYPLLRQPYKED